MKRIIAFLMFAAMLVSSLSAFTACGGNKNSETTSAEGSEAVTTDDGLDRTHGQPTQIDPDEIEFQKNTTELKEVTPASDSKTVDGDGFTAETAGKAWSINSGIDFSKFNYAGGGAGLVDAVKAKYPKAKITYFQYSTETEKRKSLSEEQVKGVSNALAFYSGDSKKMSVILQTIEPRVQFEYKSIKAKAGYFISVPFKSNLPGSYTVNISATKNSTTGKASFTDVTAKGKNGEYSGGVYFTVPFITPGDYYINILADRKCVDSVPITIEESEYSDLPYHLLLTGHWELVNNMDRYIANITKLFYTTYPRLLARFGMGGEPKEISFSVEPDSSVMAGAAAWASGNTVVVHLDHANNNPNDIGFFSHEITHSAQQYRGFTSSWWVENMANFGGFRYFHWSNPEFIQIYDTKTQSYLWDWGWEPYGDGSKLFFSYLDYKWPTTKNEDGSLNYGLIDSINRAIKQGKLDNDDPKKTSTRFSKLVKEVTGFDCMEDIRLQYAADCKSGDWKFEGFANYVDNFLTEDLPGCENAQYPMMSDPVHGDKTAAALDKTVTEGDNLALGGTIHSSSGSVNQNESPEKLIDGNLKTKWCCSSPSNPAYCLDGARFWLIIDLGEKKTFNTYTIYNTKTQENFGNMSEWELLISDDPDNINSWTSIDYQTSAKGNITSYNVGEVSARYLLLKVYNGDGSKGTIRLYEFQLYNVK